MKPLQSLKGTTDRLGDHVLVIRRRLHSMRRGIIKSLERNPPAISRPKIEILRDICEQPASLVDQLHQQSFPHFKDLPAEIRLLIWHFASTAGRVVELQWSKKEIGFRNCAAPRPPAILHTCHESRSEALKTFRPYFSMEGSRKPIYIDPVNDVMFFRVPPGSYSWQGRHEWMTSGRPSRRMELLREELRGIQRVAILSTDLVHDSMPFSLDPLWLPPDLKEFIVLWADWSLRTYEGRGVNFIEGVSPYVHQVNHDVRRLRNTFTLNSWEERLRLGKPGCDEFGRVRPVLSLKHWCLRDEEKENIS